MIQIEGRPFGEVIKDIIRAHPDGECTPQEKAFLEARKSYLTKEEKERFGIDAGSGKKEKENEIPEGEKKLEDMTVDELKETAEGLEADVRSKATKKEIIAAIRAKQAEIE